MTVSNTHSSHAGRDATPLRGFRIGSGSGFWGDALDPALELVEHGDIRVLSMDYLAELTMALLQRSKRRDPHAGWIPDLVPHLRELLPAARRRGVRIVCNGGGVNPRGAAAAVADMARKEGLEGLRIGLVEGDNVLDRLDELSDAGERFVNLDTGDDDFAAIRDRVVAANVYTDASGIVKALEGNADVVIAGRVSDNALYVGPIMHAYGWHYDDEHADRIASAICLGHVVECAAGCTGGMSSRFAEMPRMGEVGFPIVEMFPDGSATISKVAGSGGRIDAFTVKEHLVYEIADPRSYIMPDGIADFTSLTLRETAPDVVAISGVRGRGRPETLKLIIGYEDGWIGEALLLFPWPDALDRAEKARRTLLERFDRLGLKSEAVHFDLVGVNALHGPAAPAPSHDAGEVGLRVAVKTRTRDEAEKVRRAATQLWIMGPGGTAFGTPMKPRPVTAVWPTLISRRHVQQFAEILEV